MLQEIMGVAVVHHLRERDMQKWSNSKIAAVFIYFRNTFNLLKGEFKHTTANLERY